MEYLYHIPFMCGGDTPDRETFLTHLRKIHVGTDRPIWRRGWYDVWSLIRREVDGYYVESYWGHNLGPFVEVGLWSS